MTWILETEATLGDTSPTPSCSKSKVRENKGWPTGRKVERGEGARRHPPPTHTGPAGRAPSPAPCPSHPPATHPAPRSHPSSLGHWLPLQRTVCGIHCTLGALPFLSPRAPALANQKPFLPTLPSPNFLSLCHVLLKVIKVIKFTIKIKENKPCDERWYLELFALPVFAALILNNIIGSLFLGLLILDIVCWSPVMKTAYYITLALCLLSHTLPPSLIGHINHLHLQYHDQELWFNSFLTHIFTFIPLDLMIAIISRANHIFCLLSLSILPKILNKLWKPSEYCYPRGRAYQISNLTIPFFFSRLHLSQTLSPPASVRAGSISLASNSLVWSRPPLPWCTLFQEHIL